MQTLWSLGHRKKKTVEKNLYSNQLVQKIIESLVSGDLLEDWMVWCSGWANWKNFKEVNELMEEFSLLEKLNGQSLESSEPPSFPNPQSTPPILTPQHVPIEQNVITILETVPEVKLNTSYETENNESNWSEKRKFKRADTRFRCIISSSAITFRTFTQNISLGGVALEDTIPNELLGNECTIYITSPNKRKNLKFNIKVTQRPGAKFFSFENSNEAFMIELNQWIEDSLTLGSKSKKVS